jgi:putative membrane protein
VPALLAALAIGLQVAYPLVTGPPRDTLTVLTVVALLAASLVHAVAAQGAAWAAGFLALVLPVTFAVELLGVRTGFPFGSYAYDGGLGPAVAGVPLAVPLAWAMFSYPALVVGRLLGRPVLAGAWALTSWDLFLDPQMVAAGHWHFAAGGVPLTNTAGWLAVSLLLMGLLARLPWRRGPVAVPVALFLWTWLGSALANLVFFGRPLVALAGFVGMGCVAVPLLRVLVPRGQRCA